MEVEGEGKKIEIKMGNPISCVYVPVLFGKGKKKLIATVQPVFKGSQVFPVEAGVDNRSLCSPRNTQSLLGFNVSVRF